MKQLTLCHLYFFLFYFVLLLLCDLHFWSHQAADFFCSVMQTYIFVFSLRIAFQPREGQMNGAADGKPLKS